MNVPAPRLSGPGGRPRARALGLRLGRYPTGTHNAITDVRGVRVGHATLIAGSGPLRVGEGPVRTGVTAILPNDGDIFEQRYLASGFVLNGAGEVSGLTQIMEWGLIETPILLTNTLSVGTVSAATVRHMVQRYPGIGDVHDVIIPVVGECDDSWLNDAAGPHVRSEHVFAALEAAASGPVAEGSVGGGAGLMTCDFNAGIGTASRVLDPREGGYTVGVLVMSNFGLMRQLRVDGVAVGEVLEPRYRHLEKRIRNDGSIIAVVATDAPLLPLQLTRLCKRAALGIGRVGSHAAHGSGEIIVGFSTANTVPRHCDAMTYEVRALLDQRINPLYEAVVEATEEAIVNSLFVADTMEGHSSHVAPGLPAEEVVEIVERVRGTLRAHGRAPSERR